MTSHRDHNHPATPAARAACRKIMAEAATERNLAVDHMLAEFDDADQVWATYLTKACRKFCGDAHETWGHDEVTGQPWTNLHHTSRRDCAAALVDSGATIRQIRWSFS